MGFFFLLFNLKKIDKVENRVSFQLFWANIALLRMFIMQIRQNMKLPCVSIRTFQFGLSSESFTFDFVKVTH